MTVLILADEGYSEGFSYFKSVRPTCCRGRRDRRRRSSATPTGLAEENGHLPPVQSMCGASVEVAWLPIAFSADVRMSMEQAARSPHQSCRRGGGVYHYILRVT